jgi:putative transcriptional regulator
MTITHHISDELLLEYAAGSLAEGWSVAVATHLALCPHCRTRLKAMEATAAGLLEEIEPAPVGPGSGDAWAAMKDRLAAVAPEAPARTAQPAPKGPAPDVPEPLRSYLGGDLASLKWRALGLGAYHYPIATGDKTISTRLLRIPAGKPVPEHGHGGRELTLVLKGAFHDEDGRFGPGDFEETDSAVQHQPIAEPGEDCICLAVTDAPLRFRSRVVRFIQPLLGI